MRRRFFLIARALGIIAVSLSVWSGTLDLLIICSEYAARKYVKPHAYALKRLSRYAYKLVCVYYTMQISKRGLMYNDKRNKSDSWRMAVCLLEELLTRANRAH
jgi:hypothetical protein